MAMVILVTGTKKIKRSIKSLINLHTGLEEDAMVHLQKPVEYCIRLRRVMEEKILENDPLYACAFCIQPVVLRAGKYSDQFHFKHMHDSDDCPIKTSQNYTKEEILAMKYNGRTESKKHKFLKEYLAKTISNDARFSNINVEKTMRGTGVKKEWKKPDVSAEYEGRKVVFEIQLSTTFLDVIVKREVFYKKEEVYIFWVFDKFDPAKIKMAEKDIYFHNKCNVFAIDDESMEFTDKGKGLAFKGFYTKPEYYTNSEYHEYWDSKLVPFEKILFCDESFKPYFSDRKSIFEEAFKLYQDKQAKIEKYKKLAKEQERIEEIEMLERRKLAQKNRDELEATIFREELVLHAKKKCPNEFGSFLSRKLKDSKLPMDYISDTDAIFMKCILSISENQPLIRNQGWKYIVNYVQTHHINKWKIFSWVVCLFHDRERLNQLTKKRFYEVHSEFKASQPKQDVSLLPLVEFMFPSMKGKIKN